MWLMIRWVAIAISFLLLNGCSAFIVSDVTVFHEIPESFPGTTYAVIPFKEQQNSLEHRNYELSVKRELSSRGFSEVPAEDADIVIFITYGIDDGKQVVESYPIFGKTGVSSSYTTGSLYSYGRYGNYSGTTTYTPTYGVVGTGVSTSTVYTRYFKLEILDKDALAKKQIIKLYEGKVESKGGVGHLPVVLPYMIKALFEDFPGKSGSTRRSKLTIDE